MVLAYTKTHSKTTLKLMFRWAFSLMIQSAQHPPSRHLTSSNLKFSKITYINKEMSNRTSILRLFIEWFLKNLMKKIENTPLTFKKAFKKYRSHSHIGTFPFKYKLSLKTTLERVQWWPEECMNAWKKFSFMFQWCLDNHIFFRVLIF